jgi:hypothetical protein
MKTFFKIFGIFLSTILFLSIEVRDETIFSHIYSGISPATKMVQTSVERFFDSSLNNTHRYSKKLFENSVPKLKDSVKSKMSSSKKIYTQPQEDILINEKQELDDLIKSN